MFWIAAGFFSLAIIFWSLGKAWERRYRKPALKEMPKVSILIPAYKSEGVIESCLRAVKELDYPHKEVIVVNDYPDRTPEIAKSFGVTVMDSKTRRGKAASLNEAAKKATGDILFFLDADTVLERGCLKKLVPWFADPKVAVVAPKYVARNRKGLMQRLVSLENSYNSTMFKMHMFFGSMISFRGCGIAIRKSAFEKLGGWSKTLIEDSDFAAKALHSGYRIQYEPHAIVETIEPVSFSEMKRQKLRWGRGAGFSIFNNRKAYAETRQALFHFLPYVALNSILVLIVLKQTLSVTLTPSYLYDFISMLATIFAFVTVHNFIIMWPERMKWTDAIYVPLYTILYMPVVLVCYIGGIAAGIAARARHRTELDFKHW
jgi:cellulose synthase/poly-beta-1,6-N-acetylglucosamine synthase-like glycosyltransferase